MKTMLNESNRTEIINRIQNVQEDSVPLWGKMTAYQAMKHLRISEEMYLGKTRYKQKFLGKLLGKRILRAILANEEPLRKNSPTADSFIVIGSGNFVAERDQLIQLIREYAHYSLNSVTHWFFGKMTAEQVGIFSYKHFDHHLRQFGC